jgi:hypothetical protein
MHAKPRRYFNHDSLNPHDSCQIALTPTLGVIASPCEAIQGTSENWRELLDRFARARDDDL